MGVGLSTVTQQLFFFFVLFFDCEGDSCDVGDSVSCRGCYFTHQCVSKRRWALALGGVPYWIHKLTVNLTGGLTAPG
ncbi:uncharacterized protein BDW43DRAFT_279237 [Aspergillus alliaceus]|uniref:uncharacterized protein n=1 Tax=Petromyces alliaceus TaxID=209559 RepID=UPI0012A75CC7|nr:uncharacterized protein BDW43DRAFT_279237 [Aspergillus alliaceus]KAB8232364.1 hypothetical protein BDW43DRAFT_279237 [Aspergillus alliaceus]